MHCAMATFVETKNKNISIKMKSMKVMLVVTLILFTPQFLFPHTISGMVVKENTKQPVEFVNVLVVKASTNSLVSGTITDQNGRFEIPNLLEGEYFVRFSLVGFKDKQVPHFNLNQQQPDKNFGTITLEETVVQVEDVVVTAQKLLMNVAIDRKVYNVDQDVMSKSGSASELLRNIPSVEVDIEGNVSLRGSPNVIILINGKTSPLMGKSQAVVLEQLPAESIERVELITNPSAKYKPDGATGIINIVLKKNSTLGLNGSVTGNVGSDSRYNGNVRLNYNPNNLNVFGSLSHRKDSRNRTSAQTEDGLPPKVYHFYQDVVSNARPTSNMVALGFDYKLGQFDNFGVSGDYFRNDFTRTDKNLSRTQNAARIDTSAYTRSRHDDEFEKEYAYTAFYEHTFDKEDHTLRAEFKSSQQTEQEDNKYTNLYSLPTLPNSYDNMLIATDELNNEFTLDYSNPFSEETKLEAGYGIEATHADYNFHGENYNTTVSQFLLDTTRSNRFTFGEAIHSLFATLEHKFGLFGVMAGLRTEYVSTQIDQHTSKLSFGNSYANLYLSLHLSYKISEEYEFQLNYSKRTRRPDAEDMNPFPEYQDPRTVSRGNEKLLPEYIHSVECGIKLQNDWLSVLPSIYYRYTYNRMTSVSQKMNDTVTINTRQNLSNDQSTGAECILSVGINELFSSNLSANVYYNEIDASNLGFTNKRSTVTWSGALTMNMHLMQSTMFQLNSYYNAARLTPQGESQPSYVVNVGLRQELFEKSLSIVLTAADVFKTQKRENNINAIDFTGWSKQQRDSQVIYFGLTYYFGSTTKKSKKEDALRYDNGM